jgi:uncharacterized protein (DUF1800 family)
MSGRALLGFICVAGLASGFAAYGRNDSAAARRQMSKDAKIQHALNRLTFGARPDDAASVRKVGLKKWLDRQLHPERIAENPVLEEKLKYLDSLNMSSQDLVRNFPTPQLVRAMVDGRETFPADPERLRMIRNLVVRAKKKQGDGAGSSSPELPKLTELLTAPELRSLRAGTPRQRLAAIQALPPEKVDSVIAALPPGMRQQLFAVAPPELRRKLELTSSPQQVVARDLAEGKLLRAIYGNRQLEEVLTDFWFNHFNIYLDKGADRYLVTGYERDVIRPRVLGKFRDLLKATAKSPAMLFYLDNWQSVGPETQPARRAKNSRGLNENYGRELLELHTLGVDGGYTQKDVTEVARCFTGWSIQRPQLGGGFVFNSRLHDSGEKVVLGVTIPAGGGIEDGEKVLDILARHASTAQLIARKLAQRFVADDPPAGLVNRMAEAFQKSDGDLRAVMESMLNSKEFWSEGAFRSKMKSPLEMVASAVRAVNGDVDFAFPLVNQVAQLGEPLYRKQEPTGYSNSSQEWLTSAGLLSRMNFAVQLASGKVPGVIVENADAATLGSPEFQKR